MVDYEIDYPGEEERETSGSEKRSPAREGVADNKSKRGDVVECMGDSQGFSDMK